MMFELLGFLFNFYMVLFCIVVIDEFIGKMFVFFWNVVLNMEHKLNNEPGDKYYYLILSLYYLHFYVLN